MWLYRCPVATNVASKGILLDTAVLDPQVCTTLLIQLISIDDFKKIYFPIHDWFNNQMKHLGRTRLGVLRGHSYNTWHFLGTFLSPPPSLCFRTHMLGNVSLIRKKLSFISIPLSNKTFYFQKTIISPGLSTMWIWFFHSNRLAKLGGQSKRSKLKMKQN